MALASLILFLKVIEYRYLIRKLNVETYVGITALLFTVVGIWLGWIFIRKRENSTTTDTAVSEKSEIATAGDHREALSEREMDVLLLMAEGLSNQEIADRLFISIHTVKTHSSNLFSKLHVKRRTQAIRKSKQIGLIS